MPLCHVDPAGCDRRQRELSRAHFIQRVASQGNHDAGLERSNQTQLVPDTSLARRTKSTRYLGHPLAAITI